MIQIQIKGKLLNLLVKRRQHTQKQVWETNVVVKCVFSMYIYTCKMCHYVFSICIECKYLREHGDKMCVYVNVWTCQSKCTLMCIKCHLCVCVCVHSIKVFSSQSRSKPSSSAAAAVREPVPEWEQSDEKKGRVQPSQKDCSLRKHCSPVPPGSSPPLYLRPQLPTTARDFLLQMTSPVGSSQTYTEN